MTVLQAVSIAGGQPLSEELRLGRDAITAEGTYTLALMEMRRLRARRARNDIARQVASAKRVMKASRAWLKRLKPERPGCAAAAGRRTGPTGLTRVLLEPRHALHLWLAAAHGSHGFQADAAVKDAPVARRFMRAHEGRYRRGFAIGRRKVPSRIPQPGAASCAHGACFSTPENRPRTGPWRSFPRAAAATLVGAPRRRGTSANSRVSSRKKQ